jgi:positive regulator of sigma E activity
MTKITLDNIKEGLILFVAQMVSFAVISINYRAIAQANYLWSILTDIIVATLSFFVIRRIAKSNCSSAAQWIGFTIGSATGTALGIFISKIILGN